MLGREAEFLEILERAYRAHLDAGDPLAAIRCAFWVGVNLTRQGEMGRALHVIEDCADDPARDRPEAFLRALHVALGRTVTREPQGASAPTTAHVGAIASASSAQEGQVS